MIDRLRSLIAIAALLASVSVSAGVDSIRPFLDGEIRCHDSAHGYRCNYASDDQLIAARRAQDVSMKQDALWKLKTKSEETGCFPVQIVTIVACQSKQWVMDEGNAATFEILDLSDLKKPMWMQ